jgi:hypothetical protein
LQGFLPPVRKPWMPEDDRMAFAYEPHYSHTIGTGAGHDGPRSSGFVVGHLGRRWPAAGQTPACAGAVLSLSAPKSVVTPLEISWSCVCYDRPSLHGFANA